MALASTGKALGAAEESAENPPVDTEGISLRTDSILAMRMGSTTREDIDEVTPAVVQHLNLLLDQDLGADEDAEVQQLVRKGLTLIDSKERPTAETPTFGAWLYARDVATLTRRLLWVYTERNGLGAP
ncbi:hypothetical protein BLA24_26050 [Streptomyces cinnamoneus]|uniref:Uncharacterized protein n=1 Tax=Streptomyces cinnamoneus TaxID=53446 RepID=A0A2G1XE39_STRCJ|nr:MULTISPECIES: hypothetical protein [Streptomyces]PHQ49500.1 hypothetical protein BLA24_26050 [Streptomyces cinnamoneus]PPT14849.1 hypothetical protein CYQ11_20015 [Streptomyces cinnamoneus]